MLLGFGQRLLNEQIQSSTAARARLDELDGRRFAVVVRDSDMRFVAEVCGDSLQLSWGNSDACDVELTAGTLDLLKLVRSSDLAALKDSGATLNGDLHVAEAFADLMRLALPDPAGLLADFVGDMPAHAISEIAGSAVRLGRQAKQAAGANLAEYLQEERPTLVPPALSRQFQAGIDRLRDDVDRAERRIELLERRRGKTD